MFSSAFNREGRVDFWFHLQRDLRPNMVASYWKINALEGYHANEYTFKLNAGNKYEQQLEIIGANKETRVDNNL